MIEGKKSVGDADKKPDIYYSGVCENLSVNRKTS